jgi:aminoglycoside phosphotransferase (APT) family kinase protein
MPTVAPDPTLSPDLRRWLSETLDESPKDLEIDPLGGSGDSNLMYLVSAGPRRWVLRMPPAAKNDRSAHDVLREFRMLKALELTTVPHPRPIEMCGDQHVAGRPFYLMENVEGFSPTPSLGAPWADETRIRRGLGLRAAEALADLAAVDYVAVGLEDFGRPKGFLARQVPRWRRQLDATSVRQLHGLPELGTWLEEHRPPDRAPGILHGDFHLRNVMFATEAPARVTAIVDWEMSTIGDPLLDLGALLATWSQAGETELINGSISSWPGMATRSEIAAAYEARSGCAVEQLGYYMVLALFKLACILEGSYARLLAGKSEHEGHRTYETLVPTIVRRAQDIVARQLTV